MQFTSFHTERKWKRRRKISLMYFFFLWSLSLVRWSFSLPLDVNGLAVIFRDFAIGSAELSHTLYVIVKCIVCVKLIICNPKKTVWKSWASSKLYCLNKMSVFNWSLRYISIFLIISLSVLLFSLFSEKFCRKFNTTSSRIDGVVSRIQELFLP